MSRRSFFSRLLAPRRQANSATNTKILANHHSWLYRIVRFFIVVALMLSALWLLFALWYQFGALSPITWLASILIVGFLASIMILLYAPTLANKITNKTLRTKKLSKFLTVLYSGLWLVGVGWYFSIEAKSDRDWQPEVSEVLSYTRDANNPNLITFNKVRNFDWYLEDKETDGAPEILATERWESRTVDISKLSGVDITNSYWMGPLIAHTLVSFRFEDDRPLAFSFEIRKEDDESFSAFAGFFRRFELSLIASEERDIIYTRSNARGEQVYLFPISHLQKHEVKALFESYLEAADELVAEPSWYNTFTTNCTNIIFYMARIVSGERLPWDYRIWVSGWLPNYLFDIGMLDANPAKQGQPWSMDTWYERTHINPKVQGFDNYADAQINDQQLIENSRQFSKQIREGLPIPPLADSQLEAESLAKSAAKLSRE
ncbi:Lnb N-terminal periplasmic domain-containing protein [Psychrobacter sp. 1U2]|uniref:Lnb N-terminal periplasmic domain-containing protein n=1 Tax=Psychrobacter sp. 1U2 TaxID=3453577 RepID=UPI003F48AF76